MSKLRTIRRYCSERDAMLRTLEPRELTKFAKRWNRPLPDKWEPKADIACMHKMRLAIVAFSNDEKELSRKWLLANGFVATAHGYKIDNAMGTA